MFNAKPMLVRKEGSISTFRRWFSQFYSGILEMIENNTVDHSPILTQAEKDNLSW